MWSVKGPPHKATFAKALWESPPRQRQKEVLEEIKDGK